MLSKSQRLPSSHISALMKFGKRVSNETFSLLVMKQKTNTGGRASRFAFIVSTKTDKRATARNRIRRLVSESVRRMRNRVKPGFDCILIVRRNISAMNQTDVERIVTGLFRKAGITEEPFTETA